MKNEKVIVNLTITTLFLFCNLVILGQRPGIQEINIPYSTQGIVVNLDSIKSNLPLKPVFTFVIVRAENNPDRLIRPLDPNIEIKDTNLVKIIAYGLATIQGTGADYFRFNVIFSDSIIQARGSPPNVYILSSDHENLKNLYELSEDVMRHHEYEDILLLAKNAGDAGGSSEVYEKIKSILHLLHSPIWQAETLKEEANIKEKQTLGPPPTPHQPTVSLYQNALFSNLSASGEYLVFNRHTPVTWSMGLGLEWWPGAEPRRVKVGAGLSMQRVHFSQRVSMTNALQIDTLTVQQTDQHGDPFYRVIYNSGLEENVATSTMALTPYIILSYGINEKFSVTARPGITSMFPYKATSRAVSGEISFGALYPQYGNDTLFSGQFGNIQQMAPDKSPQSLGINSMFVALNIPVGVEYRLGEHTGLFMEVQYAVGLTNLLSDNKRSAVSSDGQGTYYSMLSRSDRLCFGFLGVGGGIRFQIK